MNTSRIILIALAAMAFEVACIPIYHAQVCKESPHSKVCHR